VARAAKTTNTNTGTTCASHYFKVVDVDSVGPYRAFRRITETENWDCSLIIMYEVIEIVNILALLLLFWMFHAIDYSIL
jgi:hypothetical protein